MIAAASPRQAVGCPPVTDLQTARFRPSPPACFLSENQVFWAKSPRFPYIRQWIRQCRGIWSAFHHLPEVGVQTGLTDFGQHRIDCWL